MNTNVRYQGKPLLRLLECYVLDAIGSLTDDERKNLATMQPKLEKVYNRSGTWQKMIEEEMDFSSQMRDSIVQVWLHNQQIANEKGIELPPQKFAEMFVDHNFRQSS
jgi:hypothetical protein